MTQSNLQYLNPDSLHRNPAFSQVVTIPAQRRLVVVGGQNAVDVEGKIVGKGDIAAQTSQALSNLEAALAAAQTGFQDLVKWSIYLVPPEGDVAGASLRAAFGAAMGVVGRLEHAPAISVIQVAGLAHPDFLVEIEALAAVAE